MQKIFERNSGCVDPWLGLSAQPTIAGKDGPKLVG